MTDEKLLLKLTHELEATAVLGAGQQRAHIALKAIMLACAKVSVALFRDEVSMDERRAEHARLSLAAFNVACVMESDGKTQQ